MDPQNMNQDFLQKIPGNNPVIHGDLKSALLVVAALFAVNVAFVLWFNEHGVRVAHVASNELSLEEKAAILEEVSKASRESVPQLSDEEKMAILESLSSGTAPEMASGTESLTSDE